jgi:hypothetical protein
VDSFNSKREYTRFPEVMAQLPFHMPVNRKRSYEILGKPSLGEGQLHNAEHFSITRYEGRRWRLPAASFLRRNRKLNSCDRPQVGFGEISGSEKARRTFQKLRLLEQHHQRRLPKGNFDSIKCGSPAFNNRTFGTE